jgi:hypothetical protein
LVLWDEAGEVFGIAKAEVEFDVEINVAKCLIELGLVTCSLECLGLSPVLGECAAIRVSNEAFQWRY